MESSYIVNHNFMTTPTHIKQEMQGASLSPTLDHNIIDAILQPWRQKDFVTAYHPHVFQENCHGTPDIEAMNRLVFEDRFPHGIQ